MTTMTSGGWEDAAAQLEEQLREYFRNRKQIVGKYVIGYVDLATHLCCVISRCRANLLPKPLRFIFKR